MHGELVLPEEAARRTGVSIETLFADDRLTVELYGGKYQFRGDEIEALYAEQQAKRWGTDSPRARGAPAARPSPAVTTPAPAPRARRPDREAAARIQATDAGVAARTRSARESASEYLATVDAMVGLSSLRPSAQALAEPEDRAAAIVRAFAGAGPAVPAAESPAGDADRLVEQLVGLSRLRPA